jgi:ESS family glutamate:Na+ symporter
VSWLIRSKGLSSTGGKGADSAGPVEDEVPFTERKVIVVLLLFALSVVAGDLARDVLRSYGVVMPRFLTAMLAGVAISMVADLGRLPIDRTRIDRCGDICLSIFIVMALCGIDLQSLGRMAGPMAVMAAAQTIGTVLFAHFLVFWPMGRNFEAAATAGGVIGFGLSSFAVAMATVKQVERHYGPAPQAMLLTTLVGGAVSNLANALVILAFYDWLVG